MRWDIVTAECARKAWVIYLDHLSFLNSRTSALFPESPFGINQAILSSEVFAGTAGRRLPISVSMQIFWLFGSGQAWHVAGRDRA